MAATCCYELLNLRRPMGVLMLSMSMLWETVLVLVLIVARLLLVLFAARLLRMVVPLMARLLRSLRAPSKLVSVLRTPAAGATRQARAARVARCPLPYPLEEEVPR